MNRFSKALIVPALLALALGCGEDLPLESTEGGPPQVTSLEKTSLSVGEPLSFYGRNFLAASDGKTKLEFVGTYYWDDGQGNVIPEKVSQLTIAPLYDGEFEKGGTVDGIKLSSGTHVLRWNRFGPFDVPFSHDGNRPGTFKGTVRAVNYHNDGRVIADPEPLQVNIEVRPSIIFTLLEPVIGKNPDGTIRTAGCGSPALRAMGGLPYVFEVEAIGFTPEYFIYDISGINGTDSFTTFTHPADLSKNGRDRLGDPAWTSGEMVVFNQLGENEEFSIAAIRVTAVDAQNNAFYTALPLSVVRPLQFNYNGNRQLAEYYEPVVVHPPIVGGIATTVTYAETKAESRQNAVSVSISKSWSKNQTQMESSNWNEAVSQTNTSSTTNSVGVSHSEGETSSESYGASYSSSEANSSQFTSSSGSDWGWNAVSGTNQEDFETEMGELYGEASAELSTSVTGEGSIPGIAKVSGTVGTKVGAKLGAKTGNQQGTKHGSKNEHGTHMYESNSESTAYGSTTTDSSSKSVTGTYGLSTQNSISESTAETSATSDSTTYAMGGSFGISEGITEGSQETWSETWTTSTTDTQLLSYSSKVPYGRCAVIYRQTVRYVRQAHLYSYDLCGVRSLTGEMYFNEWLWSPNIVIGDDCEKQMPASSQPAAQCFLACD